MDNELYFEGKKYISSKRAAKLTGYTHDYIGQLSRAGKVVGKVIGKTRFVEEESILKYMNGDSAGNTPVAQNLLNKWEEILFGKTVSDMKKKSIVEDISPAQERQEISHEPQNERVIPLRTSNIFSIKNKPEKAKLTEEEKGKILKALREKKEVQKETSRHSSHSDRILTPYKSLLPIVSSGEVLRRAAVFAIIFSMVSGGYLLSRGEFAIPYMEAATERASYASRNAESSIAYTLSATRAATRDVLGSGAEKVFSRGSYALSAVGKSASAVYARFASATLSEALRKAENVLTIANDKKSESEVNEVNEMEAIGNNIFRSFKSIKLSLQEITNINTRMSFSIRAHEDKISVVIDPIFSGVAVAAEHARNFEVYAVNAGNAFVRSFVRVRPSFFFYYAFLHEMPYAYNDTFDVYIKGIGVLSDTISESELSYALIVRDSFSLAARIGQEDKLVAQSKEAIGGTLDIFDHAALSVYRQVSESARGLKNDVKNFSVKAKGAVLGWLGLFEESDLASDAKEYSGNLEEKPKNTIAQTDSDVDKKDKTIIERIVETRVVEAATNPITIHSVGVTEEDFERRLHELDNGLRQEIYRIQGGNSSNTIQTVYQTIAHTNKIDFLSNITVSGVTGLTDGDIPDSITASNYLPLSGGTISGDLTITGTCTGCGSGGGGTFAWAPGTTYGENANSTTTPIWLKDTLYASSTSFFTGLATLTNATSSLFTTTGQAWFNSSTTFNGVEYLFPSSDGTSGQALTTNAGGGLSWTTISGGGGGANYDWQKETNFGALTLTPTTTIPVWIKDAFYASSTLTVQGLASFGNASSSKLTVSGPSWLDGRVSQSGLGLSTFFGYEAGLNDDLTNNWNTAFGYQALRANTTGWYNTAIGYLALYSNTTGVDNVAVGPEALYTNSSGSYNIAISDLALKANTTGQSNAAMGHSALERNTTGSHNIAIGYETMYGNNVGSYNVAVGGNAGFGALDQAIYRNSLVGYMAGYGLRGNSSNNIIIGYQAGDNITTGSSNIIIGYDIDAPSATLSNQLNIGNLIFSKGIDGTGTTLSSGNVGIGTTSPYAKLSVVGETVAEYFTATSTTATSTFAGGVGIGTTTPEFKLTLGGDGGILSEGTLGSGADLKYAGAGTRLIWYPKKAAFRAGYVNGTQWNDSSIGDYSLATGRDIIASGAQSTALGRQNTASGANSTAIGYLNTSSGSESFSAGYNALASGSGSIAMGVYVTAGSAAKAMTIGQGADGSNKLVNNTASSLMIGFNSTIPTLFIGPSSGAGTTGNIGVSTTSPYAKLTVWGDATGNIFEAVTSASSTALAVSATGFGTTTVTGLNINGSATTTSNVGMNITTGCFSVNGTCVGGGGSSTYLGLTDTQSSFTANRIIHTNAAGNALTDTAGFVFDGTNFGVGTTSPSAILSVNAPSGSSPFMVGSSTATYLSIDSVGRTTIMSYPSAHGGSSGNMIGPVLYVLNNSTPISFSGSNSAVAIFQNTSQSDFSANVYVIGGTSGDSAVNLGNTNAPTDGQIVYNNSNDRLSFRTNNVSNRMVISSTGNVGIGTTSPYAKLSVVGETVAEYFTATSTTATSYFAGKLGVGTSTPWGRFSVEQGASDTAVFVVGDQGTSTPHLKIDGAGVTTISSLNTGAMAFEDNAGQISWINMGVTSSAPSGTKESYSAQIDGNNILTVYAESNGSGGIQNSRVGIGTTSPYAKLSVVGETVAQYFTATSTTATSSIAGVFSIGSTTPNGSALFSVGTSSPIMHINKNRGLVGIGTTTPDFMLTVQAGMSDGLRVLTTNASQYGLVLSDLTYSAVKSSGFGFWQDTDGSGGVRAGATGGVSLAVGATSWAALSDERVKQNIETLSVLDRLDDYRAVSFEYIENGRRDLGVIAQEIEPIFPELISKNSEGYFRVTYDRFGALALQGLKELNDKVDAISVSAGGGVSAVASGVSSTISLSSEWLSGVLSDLGVYISDGAVKAKSFIADKVIAKKAVLDALEMTDSATGEVYCVRISNGEWSKFKGTCGEVATDIPTVSEPELATKPDVIAGCTDNAAENYNSSAMKDDGSCTYPKLTATSTPEIIHKETATTTATSIPQTPATVAGCTDGTAENYDILATEDDGSCVYTVITTTTATTTATTTPQ